MKNGIMSKGFKSAFQIRNKRRDQFDRISFKLKLFCHQILSEISGYDRGCSNLRIMDNQTGRILGMLDRDRWTLEDAAAAMRDNFQTAQVFATLWCTVCILCRAICDLPSIAFFLCLSKNISKLIWDCRASNTEILSRTLKCQIHQKRN